jgi:fermentation-respiration switch protein FrsA (DUF1100 family)
MGGVMARLKAVLRVLALRSVPFWERSPGRRLLRLGVFALYCYLGVLVVLLSLENWFLFHPTKASAEWLPPPAGLDVRDVELTSADGTRLHAWWFTPPGWEPGRGAVLYCHGNAGNLSHRGESLRLWAQEMGQAVLLFDYPGYGRSAGRPTEAGCYAAGEAAYDWLTARQKVRPQDVILYGGSLGGAIATELASRHPFRALVLMAAFTSFADMAQKTFPWLPARWLVRNKLDNVTKIARCRGPVFIAHGTADTLVPFGHGQRLYAVACEPKRFYEMVGHDHNDGAGPEFFAALRGFLAEVR